MAFQNPTALWLLLLVPLFVLVRRRSKQSVNRGREIAVIALRVLTFAALVFALAEPVRRQESKDVATYFVVDQSGSIPEGMKKWSLDVVRQAAERRANRNDRAGLILFGEKPVIEESPTPHFELRQIYSTVGPSETDIGSAVRLALSTFPGDAQKRIVLFTDGNETRGDLDAAVQRAAAAGVPIDVVPLRYHYTGEVLLESVTAPRRVQKDEPFQVRTNVVALEETRGKLRIFCDRQPVAEKEVTLAKGDNIFVFTHRLRESGFHLFEAEIVPEKDAIPQNNWAQAYSVIQEEPIVLLAGESEQSVRHLAAALEEEGIRYRVRLAGALPQDLGEWQSYDAIVLADLGAEHLSMEQMEMIESLVKDLGVGFVMVGGEHSFGAGGWLNTPIAKVLPVELDVKQMQVLPNGGVVFVIDHIPCVGDRWTKDICIGTLRGMTRWDEFGLLHGRQPEWVIPLAPAADRTAIEEVINRLTVDRMGPVDAHLEQAVAALSRRPISYRHIVLISNGNANSVPSGRMIGRIREARISMSIVVIEPLTGSHLRELEEIARALGGNFYVVQPHEYQRVPHIYLTEAQRVKKGLYFEETFRPRMVQASDILEGISADELPPLHGYNVSSRRQPTEVPLVSHHGDPVLAQWHYGVGKAVAFTSDAASRWGRDWLQWAKFRQFWAQVVRWCQRRMPPSPYQMSVQRGREDGRAEVVVDAVDEHGKFVNFLSISGTVVTPDLKPVPVKLAQVGPGRYRGVFPVEKSGGYVVNLQYEEGGRQYLLRGGYVPPCNPEYRQLRDNESLLAQIAARTGGRLVRPGTAVDFFERTGQAAYSVDLLWPILLILSACLFPLDVFLRRVMIGFADAARWLRRLLGRGPRHDPVQEALAAARESAKARAVYTPAAALPGVGTEQGTVAAAPSGEPPPQEEKIEFIERLSQAKRQAKREYEK